MSIIRLVIYYKALTGSPSSTSRLPFPPLTQPQSNSIQTPTSNVQSPTSSPIFSPSPSLTLPHRHHNPNILLLPPRSRPRPLRRLPPRPIRPPPLRKSPLHLPQHLQPRHPRLPRLPGQSGLPQVRRQVLSSTRRCLRQERWLPVLGDQCAPADVCGCGGGARA